MNYRAIKCGIAGGIIGGLLTQGGFHVAQHITQDQPLQTLIGASLAIVGVLLYAYVLKKV